MIGIPIHLFLDFNAVIVNLDSLSPEQQRDCISDIEKNIQTLKVYLEDHLSAKEKLLGIPETGLAILKQPLMLAEAIEAWIVSLKKKLNSLGTAARLNFRYCCFGHWARDQIKYEKLHVTMAWSFSLYQVPMACCPTGASISLQ